MDFVKFFGGAILLFLAFSATLMLGVNYFSEYQCGRYAETTGRPTEWVFFNACYVTDTDGTTYTRNEYQAVILARDGLLRRED